MKSHCGWSAAVPPMVVAACLASPSFGQQLTAMLTGTATDSAEAVPNDASVMAVNQRTLEAEP